MSMHPDLAAAVVGAIRRGDVAVLGHLLAHNPGLATARLDDEGGGGSSRTLLHVATDWPGHFPHVAETIGVIAHAGAGVNARFQGSHEETPLHWAASSDDVEALDALVEAGADLDANGGVIGGGTPLDDARAFAQWRAAHRLVAHGATVSLADLATLGLMDRLRDRLEWESPDEEELGRAFWGACHGGQLEAARVLLAQGADVNWLPPWEPLTPLDAAWRSLRENGTEAPDLPPWLVEHGARSAIDPA